MKQLRFLLIGAGIVMLVVPCAWTQSIRVIANPSVRADSISAGDLRSVFLEEKNSLPGGSHVEPVLARGGPAHEAFLERYLGKSDSDLRTYYRGLVFTGRGSMPKVLGSDAEVIAYVARTRGAIGYISPDTEADGVRTLTVVSAGRGPDRTLLSRIEPDYPEVLRARSIRGTVRLRVTIAASGNVQQVDIIGGDAALAEAASAAVSKWKYSPAPAPTTTEVAITFDPNQ